MLELVLLTGTIVASLFGFALITLILRNAVRKSRKPGKSPDLKPVNFSYDANSLDSIRWELLCAAMTVRNSAERMRLRGAARCRTRIASSQVDQTLPRPLPSRG